MKLINSCRNTLHPLQNIKKCCSSSTWFCLQTKHLLSSTGMETPQISYFPVCIRVELEETQFWSFTVNSRYSGHPRDRDLVSVIARVRNSGVRENFYFKPYLQKGVTCVFIFINSSTFFRPVVASKERQNFIYKQNRT